jgi:DNA-binding response OmpR family regulator
MKILVVEDDRSVRETLGIVLESYDLEARLVADGEQALEALDEQWPDVLLLDLTLEGMSGEEVYGKIRERFGRVPPTVVLSAAQQGESRARHLPGARFLAKPYTLEQLISMLKSMGGEDSKKFEVA